MRHVTYVVRWGDIWKAGITAGRRWRTFETRGAEVVNLTVYDNVYDAIEAEDTLEWWLTVMGHSAFKAKADAIPYLGSQGCGWTECYCLCDVERVA